MYLVSVIIPCYNYGHYIAETIHSILNQTYSNFEVIVVNDGSTDDTQTIVNEISNYDNRVTCYNFQNAGLSEARNRGLLLAKGDYIQFIDADDLIEKRKFEIQINLFHDNQKADIVYGGVRYFFKDAYNLAERRYTFWGKNKEWMPKFSGYGNQFLNEAIKVNYSHLSSPLFKRKFLENVGLFDTEINAVADHHFLQRCVINNAFFVYHDEYLTYSLVRWHNTNMSKNSFLMTQECILAHEKLLPLLIEFPIAYQNNMLTINSFKVRLSGSWKKIFISGGFLDIFKPLLRFLKIDRNLRVLFYRNIK